MKSVILISLLFSLQSMASVETCLKSIKPIQSEKVSLIEKQALKDVKECFKELKAAEKIRQKELKKAARAEKAKKSLLDKLAKLKEKLKVLN